LRINARRSPASDFRAITLPLTESNIVICHSKTTNTYQTVR
jgi:hypothetical protein